jgi:hypothetical protein
VNTTSLLDEPTITVNGVRLTGGQALTVRVALGNMHLWLKEHGDDVGKPLAEGYAARIEEIYRLMGIGS